MGEQYNPAFRHPHVFRRPVLQPQYTIRSTRVGATGRSVVSGTNIRPCTANPSQLGPNCSQFIVELQDRPGMNGSWRLRKLAAMTQL